MSAAPDLLGEPRHRLTRAEYEQVVATGVFDRQRVELLYGEILDMSPIGPDHASVVERLTELLVLRLVGRASIRPQLSFSVGDHSEPEPDLLVVPRKSYRQSHPSEAFLAIEVARTSLQRDRGPKAALYAEAGVPEYWIVNLVDGLIEVRREIVSGAYARVTPYRLGESITLSAFPDVEIAVADVLG